jgi:hypothetical protein
VVEYPGCRQARLRGRRSPFNEARRVRREFPFDLSSSGPLHASMRPGANAGKSVP